MLVNQAFKPKLPSVEGVFVHLHLFRNMSSSFLIYSTEDEINWDVFLEEGIISSEFIRYIETRCDESGIERLVKDVRR
ncbi:MAG: hypothetical protein P8N21_01945 [Opitutales bacterium]|nr:hypothetical protein [Opitutales bacterium]